MAFEDGMNAVSKTFKALAVIAAFVSFAIAIAGGIFGTGGAFIFFLFAIIGVIVFFLFWTPAWIIKKFVQ